jgi:4-amino-4-deoxy-L-arabinose transferase-like glycosyltransferase
VGIGWLLLLIAATWWAGLTLGGPGVAHAAAAVVGSCFFLIREAHHATYDLPLTALLMLATAATLAGMRRNSRRPWLAAGAALGLALMAKSLPLALVLYLLPTLAAAALWTDRRRGVWLGLAAVVAIGLLIAGPWHLWMLAHYPTGGGELVGEWRAGRSKSRGVFYYVPVIVALGLPWSTWLGLALWEPWRRGNDAATRRAALAVWAGFAGIFLMFSLHPAKSNRYLLPALGLWALLTAVTVTTRLRQRRATDAGRDVTSLHFPILGVVSLALAVLLAVPGKNGANVIGGPMVPIGWAVASGVVLLAVVAAGIIVYRRHAIGPIVALTTMWGLIAGPLAFGNYYGGERGVMPNRPLADRLHTEPAPAVVVWPDQVQPPPEVNEGLLFYGRRVVPTVTGDAPGSWVLEAGEGDELRVIAEP